MTYVVMWDIDGTLLTTGRAGLIAYEDAAEKVCGIRPDLTRLKTAGVIDSDVAGLVAKAAGTEPNDEIVGAILRHYEERLPDRLPERQGRVMPGVVAILERLAERTDVESVLLTGNTRAGGRAKLTYYGIARYLWEGAFSEDGRDRSEITRVARGRLADVADSNVLVVGDTPYDVRCAQAIWARALAVATGDYTDTDLADCGAWRVVNELPSPEAFEQLLWDTA